MKQLKAHIKTRRDDINTPISAYLKLGGKQTFLLESVTGGEHVARYSFIGLDPFLEFKADSKGIRLSKNNLKINTDNPIDALEEIMTQIEVMDIPQVSHFLGGAVGYFGWDSIKHIEKINIKEKNGNAYPHIHFLFPRTILAFDHAKRAIDVITFTENDDAAAEACFALIDQKLDQALASKALSIPDNKKDVFETVQSNFKKDDYKLAVEKAKHYIHEGDSFQLVLSQQFTIPSQKQPFDVYRTLRHINPSPYMFYFQFDDYNIIGSSPEILTSLHGKKATVRPIAGTRPRNIENEDAVIKDLLTDEKERAEHIMLVDLGRNDLGRVCKPNTVKTSELMIVEKYSHVLHIVSNVDGELADGKNAFDLFKATFPAGTLSGAPKVRAIEIIDELEPDKRGPYGGALGYIDFRGDMDLCIIIRTLFHKNNQYTIQAGAGLVADSDPETEYEESCNKARGMVQACL